MTLKTIDSISASGNGQWNEDALFIDENIIAVLDGATSINKAAFKGYHTSAEWFVQAFVKEYKLRKNTPNFINKIVAVVESLANDVEVKKLNVIDTPCFVMAAAEKTDNFIRLYLIGDCSIYIKKGNGEIKRYCDKRIDAFAQKSLTAKQEAVKNGSNALDAAKKQRILNKQSMNIEGGYWTVSLTKPFAAGILTAELKDTDIEKIFICSDGFDRGLDLFNAFTIEDIFSGDEKLAYYVDRIREYENLHVEDLDFPCLKKSDDVSGVLMETV